MNVALITAILTIICALWGLLTSCNFVQKCLHCFGPLTVLLQWYTFLFVGLGLLLVRTYYDIVRFDYVKYHFLKYGMVINEDGYIPDLSDSEHEALRIGPVLKVFAMGAPTAGFLAGIVVICHSTKYIRSFVKRHTELCYSATQQESLVLLVIALPLVFIIMAMRSEIRALAVMTGSAWTPHHDMDDGADWEEVKTLELAMYRMNLEVANFFQYMTIFLFGRLCVRYLRAVPAEYRTTLMTAGLQGVYLYVFAGICRCIANMVMAVLGEEKDSWRQYQMEQIKSKIMPKVEPVFTVATILCVINMLIICRMSEIKKSLPSANLKFQGVRILVLISQIQMQVLLGLKVGGQFYNLVTEHLPDKYQGWVKYWDLSEYRAELLHACLLCYECLLVAIFNSCFWSTKIDYAAARELQAAEDDNDDELDVDEEKGSRVDAAVHPLEQPLLPHAQ
mmetsp:Transcript_60337/g.127788  ORF Transcript_60337/g.127788 Transcript_60337/m.127788 type:complete len:449 (+) Transcript_60337:69-1415(+)